MTPEQLKDIRRKLGLSQAGLGNAINLSRVMIGLMERGIKPIDRRTELAVQHLFCIAEKEKKQ